MDNEKKYFIRREQCIDGIYQEPDILSYKGDWTDEEILVKLFTQSEANAQITQFEQLLDGNRYEISNYKLTSIEEALVAYAVNHVEGLKEMWLNSLPLYQYDDFYEFGKRIKMELDPNLCEIARLVDACFWPGWEEFVKLYPDHPMSVGYQAGTIAKLEKELDEDE